MLFQAILVYIRTQSTKTGERVFLQGRLSDGRNYGIVITSFKPRFYILESARAQVATLLAALAETTEQRGQWKNMRGNALCCLYFNNYFTMITAHRILRSANIACYEGDLNVSQQFLVEHNIRLCFSFSGKAEHGDTVDIRCINPHIHPPTPPTPPAQPTPPAPPAASTCSPDMLRIVSIDLETNRKREIRCLSLAGKNINKILTLKRRIDYSSEAMRDGIEIVECANEAALLKGLIREIRALDPDIITGWNVIGFDMEVVLNRMKALGITAHLGRSRMEARFVPGNSDQPDIADLPGRQVIDAMRLQRMHPSHFESYSLEHVAFEVLGRGKREKFSDNDKMDRLDELWENKPLDFLYYCLEDARLVMDILDKTGLMDLTLKRSQLCGTSISRSWASIHSFEQLYISALHTRGIIAPDVGVDRLPMTDSPGGTILPPESALFERVLLFDFKGLYPSIIRTFGIDPLAHISAHGVERAAEAAAAAAAAGANASTSASETALLYSPNKAAFLRGGGILPEILTQFYELREQAKKENDDIASYAFKILGNSFYGVLAAPGCRFAGSDIATAITSFAREILYWSKDFVEGMGYRAIYGDTDSLFLIPPEAMKDSDIFTHGRELSKTINVALAQWVQDRYKTPSYLEIEFENLFAPLFIPPLKSVASQEVLEGLEQAGLSGPLGRAKSYAGLAYTQEGFASGTHTLVIKGMEAVRSDWTGLARSIQRELLHSIFTKAGPQEITAYLSRIIQKMQEPEGLPMLIIRKRLSKPATQYKGSLPPHVRAALLAEKKRHGKTALRRIQYIMTKSGPQPLLAPDTPAKPDIAWYVEKQILPVLQSINSSAPYDLTAILKKVYNSDQQLSLWSD